MPRLPGYWEEFWGVFFLGWLYRLIMRPDKKVPKEPEFDFVKEVGALLDRPDVRTFVSNQICGRFRENEIAATKQRVEIARLQAELEEVKRQRASTAPRSAASDIQELAELAKLRERVKNDAELTDEAKSDLLENIEIERHEIMVRPRQEKQF